MEMSSSPEWDGLVSPGTPWEGRATRVSRSSQLQRQHSLAGRVGSQLLCGFGGERWGFPPDITKLLTIVFFDPQFEFGGWG